MDLRQATGFQPAGSTSRRDGHKMEHFLQSTSCNQLQKLKVPLKDANSKDGQQQPVLGKSCTIRSTPRHLHQALLLRVSAQQGRRGGVTRLCLDGDRSQLPRLGGNTMAMRP